MHLASIVWKFHINEVADLNVVEWTGPEGDNQNSKRWYTITTRDVNRKSTALRRCVKKRPCISAYCNGAENDRNYKIEVLRTAMERRRRHDSGVENREQPLLILPKNHSRHKALFSNLPASQGPGDNLASTNPLSEPAVVPTYARIVGAQDIKNISQKYFSWIRTFSPASGYTPPTLS